MQFHLRRGLRKNRMQIYPKLDSSLEIAALPLPNAWDMRLAKWISRVFSPPLVAAAGLAIAVQKMDSWQAGAWAVIYTLLAIGLPLAYIVWKIRRGEISDFHMRIRQQRIRPMLLMLVCSLGGYLLLQAAAVPPVLTILAAAGVLQSAFFLLVTLRWKISGHSTAIASLAVFLWALYGVSAVPAFLLIPLVAWARVRLSRHDLLQTVGGALAGVVFMLAALQVIYTQCGPAWMSCP
jgi:membrane-associated phospholipid phosphatase